MMWKRKRETDLYIELLRFGKARIGSGVTLKEAFDHLTGQGFDGPLLGSQRTLQNLFRGVFEGISSAEPGDRALSMDAYFNLLEHDELQQARESSNRAMGVAIIAIVISAASPLLTRFL